MESRIQFRVDEETKRLAQRMAESQGRTLSDACRELTQELAAEQRKILDHESWLSHEVNSAFEKLEDESAEFIENSEATEQMTAFKKKIKGRL